MASYLLTVCGDKILFYIQYDSYVTTRCAPLDVGGAFFHVVVHVGNLAQVLRNKTHIQNPGLGLTAVY